MTKEDKDKWNKTFDVYKSNIRFGFISTIFGMIGALVFNSHVPIIFSVTMFSLTTIQILFYWYYLRVFNNYCKEDEEVGRE